MQNRFQSWTLWIALSALIAFVILQTTGLDVTDPISILMGLLLPVMVGFGIVNDPTTHEALFSGGEQSWYQSKAMWMALSALVIYCAKWALNLDLGDTINGLMAVLLPVLSALGIVISPTATTTNETDQ